MLQSKETQFCLSATGEILWQEKTNNPVPGVPVAKIKKGDHPLKPVIEILDNQQTNAHDQVQLLNHLKLWLSTHMKTVLEPLMMLEMPQGVEPKNDAVSKIAAKVYDSLGIIPREELEEVIAALTPETRSEVRAKKIRLGPILVFIPALNKPAAVRLRALLWSMYNDDPLPAKVPSDGIVSAKIEDPNAKPEFYRSIGYPLYGGRAVRIDMLDRVISCVYDHAEGGKFQARHEMAEWLGCSIADLYSVLEAMGHTKIHDPAEVFSEEKVEEEKTEEPKTDEKKEVKPELATFRLKKGKAFQKSSGGEKLQQKEKPKKSPKKKDNKKKQKRDDGPRVISVEAKVKEEDNPFAILKQLKK
ncbi:MAG: hypothetical protein GC137_03765 [Alphaproteobacteria bacterium]|nr:hypothetical protein [Alphaproteobacteria bacterium]